MFMSYIRLTCVTMLIIISYSLALEEIINIHVLLYYTSCLVALGWLYASCKRGAVGANKVVRKTTLEGVLQGYFFTRRIVIALAPTILVFFVVTFWF